MEENSNDNNDKLVLNTINIVLEINMTEAAIARTHYICDLKKNKNKF